MGQRQRCSWTLHTRLTTRIWRRRGTSYEKHDNLPSSRCLHPICSGLSVLRCPLLPSPSMVSESSNPSPAKMNIGEVIIAAVIRAAAIERAEHPTPDSTIFVWASNAEEQIEAALNEAGYTLCPNKS